MMSNLLRSVMRILDARDTPSRELRAEVLALLALGFRVFRNKGLGFYRV